MNYLFLSLRCLAVFKFQGWNLDFRELSIASEFMEGYFCPKSFAGGGHEGVREAIGKAG